MSLIKNTKQYYALIFSISAINIIVTLLYYLTGIPKFWVYLLFGLLVVFTTLFAIKNKGEFTFTYFKRKILNRLFTIFFMMSLMMTAQTVFNEEYSLRNIFFVSLIWAVIASFSENIVTIKTKDTTTK